MLCASAPQPKTISPPVEQRYVYQAGFLLATTKARVLKRALIDFSWQFGILPVIQPSWLWNQECSAFFLLSKVSVAMGPKPTSVLVVEAWSLILTDSYAYMLLIDIFF